MENARYLHHQGGKFKLWPHVGFKARGWTKFKLLFRDAGTTGSMKTLESAFFWQKSEEKDQSISQGLDAGIRQLNIELANDALDQRLVLFVGSIQMCLLHFLHQRFKIYTQLLDFQEMYHGVHQILANC